MLLITPIQGVVNNTNTIITVIHFILFFHLHIMLDVESKENCTFMGNWSEEELQHAFDKIKFANCSINAVSKEHGIFRQTLRDYLIFSSIKIF